MSPKLVLGIGLLVMIAFWSAPAIFRAMKKHDYDMMYQGIQEAKRQGGSFVQEKEKPYKSYAAKYAKGEI